jgi:hypothetical protein
MLQSSHMSRAAFRAPLNQGSIPTINGGTIGAKSPEMSIIETESEAKVPRVAITKHQSGKKDDRLGLRRLENLLPFPSRGTTYPFLGGDAQPRDKFESSSADVPEYAFAAYGSLADLHSWTKG